MEGFAFLIFQTISQFFQDCAEYVFFFFCIEHKVSFGQLEVRKKGGEGGREGKSSWREGGTSISTCCSYRILHLHTWVCFWSLSSLLSVSHLN